MTYYTTLPAARRSFRNVGPVGRYLSRLGVALVLTYAISAALALNGPPEFKPGPSNDWHGNVARSASTPAQ